METMFVLSPVVEREITGAEGILEGKGRLISTFPTRCCVVRLTQVPSGTLLSAITDDNHVMEGQ